MQDSAKTRRILGKWLGGAALALLLAAVFLAYLQPTFMLDIANRIVLCW